MNDPESNQKGAHNTQTPDSQSPSEDKKLDVRTSQLAVVSCIYGIFALLAAIVATFSENFHAALIFPITAFVLGILAFILGIMSLGRIGKGKGILTGKGFAAIGIAIPTCLFLFIIVYSSLHRVRGGSVAYRLYCGTNLSGIGKAILIYAMDYDDQFPRAGGRNSTWGPTSDFEAGTAAEAYGLNEGPGQASISANFYLLVKYAEVTPKSFFCRGDKKTTEFTLAKYKVRNKDMVDLWDFGPDPSKHCGYTYHLPYGKYPLSASSDPGLAVAADRNPWLPSPTRSARSAKNFQAFDPNGTRESVKRGNAFEHQGDGQNVLFVDGHTTFEKQSFCGLNDDNIYTSQNGADIRRGTPPTRKSQPADPNDSLLLHDPPTAIWK